MLKIVACFLLLTDAVICGSFFFPDQVSSEANSESWYGDSRDRGNQQPFDYYNRHQPAFNEHYNGNNGGFVPGIGNHHHGHNNRGHRQKRPYYDGIVSQSEANAQSSGFGSQANSQSGSEFFNGVSQSNAQSQGHQAPAYLFRPSHGGSGASSASSAASATSGIVNGVATASAAAAAAASASSGGGASISSSSSSSSSSGYNGDFGNGQSQIPPWLFRSRTAGEDGSSDTGNDNADFVATSGTTNDKLIFSAK